MEEVTWPAAFLEEYEVIEAVGAGGMARVYRAVHRSLGRTVAIKLLAPQAFTEADSRKRFERERDVCVQLKHANIVPLLSFGEANGRPYLVFEFIEGESLRDVLLRKRRLELVAALRYARHIAQGLSEAHKRGIVHRDLKPDNVLISQVEDEARVADFGLARETKPDPNKQRLTQAGIILGTPGYLPPELIRGEAPTPAADMFSLGIMLFEMITGYLPLDAPSEHEMLIRYLREDLPPMSARGVAVPQRVEKFVASLLKRDPAQRLASAEEAITQLTRLERKGDAPDGPATREGRPHSRPSSSVAVTRPVSQAAIERFTPASGARFVRKHPGVSAAVLAMLAALLVGSLGGLLWMVRPAPREAPPATYAISAPPQIVAGVTSASVRWDTPVPMKTRLRVWLDGGPELAGRVLQPPPGAPESGTHHELRVRGMTEGRYVCAPLFPDDTRTPVSYPIELRTDLRPMISDAEVRYLDGGRLEVAFEVREDVTAGVLLREAGSQTAGAALTEGEPVWAPARGPRKVQLAVPMPSSAYVQPVVLFRELDDTDPLTAARNRVPQNKVPSLDTLRRTIEGLWKPPHEFDTAAATGEIIRLFTKFYPGAKVLPLRKQVIALDEERRRAVRAESRKIAQKYLAPREVDVSLLESAVPVWRRSTSLSMEERRRLYAALMRLADLDGACELVAGVPVIGLDRDMGLRVPAQPNERIPEEGFHPLAHITDPDVAKIVHDQALAMVTAGDSGEADVVQMWHEHSGVLDSMRKLSLPDPQDPEHKNGFWVGLPELPADFKADGPLRILVRVSGLLPEYRLWVRLGKETLVCFRTPLADVKGMVTTPMKAAREEILNLAQTMIADLPAGYVEPGARALALRLEAFPTADNGIVPPTTAWVSELAILPKP